jgi:hypothetical protein
VALVGLEPRTINAGECDTYENHEDRLLRYALRYLSEAAVAGLSAEDAAALAKVVSNVAQAQPAEQTRLLEALGQHVGLPTKDGHG